MSKHKLLLADDSITIQKVVNLTFADEGIEVISVGDGNAAMEKLAEFTPDLVMVDINMPGLSGYEICERIRANEATRQIPVILLVGSFEPFDEQEARRVGANDFLTKPFQSIRQLVTKVSGLLDSSAGSQRSSTDEIISDLETPATTPIPSEFEDTLKMHKEEDSSAPEEFGDSGMDDEMIQTNQVGSFGLDEMQKLQSPTENETDDDAKTQPLSTAELDEFNGYQTIGQEVTQDEHSSESLEVEEPVSTEAERGYAFVGETPYSEPTPVAEAESFPIAEAEMPAENQYFSQNDYSNQPQEAQFAPTAESDPALELEDEGNLLELPPQEHLSAAALSQPVWQDAFAPIEDSIEPNIETQASESFEKPELQSYEASHFAPDEETVFEEKTDETQFESNYEVQEYVTGETTAENQSEAVEIQEAVTAPLSETNQIDSSEPIEAESSIKDWDTPSETAEISSLSPEVIEAIAAKISERFSDRVIREIVAEVTPQITELIAKRIAEESSRE